MNSSHAMNLCREAVEASSITAVAEQLDRGDGKPYSRTAISLYLSGNYSAGVEKLETAILARYDMHACTHNGMEISGPECKRRATAPRPFGGRAKEAHWQACQLCEHNKYGSKS